MVLPQPFSLDVPEKTIAEIRTRVAAFPWHEMPDDGGWEYGVNLDYLREFCAYWVDRFDWSKQQDAPIASIILPQQLMESICISFMKRAVASPPDR